MMIPAENDFHISQKSDQVSTLLGHNLTQVHGTNIDFKFKQPRAYDSDYYAGVGIVMGYFCAGQWPSNNPVNSDKRTGIGLVVSGGHNTDEQTFTSDTVGLCLQRDTAGNYVGIGNISPSYKLDVMARGTTSNDRNLFRLQTYSGTR